MNGTARAKSCGFAPAPVARVAAGIATARKQAVRNLTTRKIMPRAEPRRSSEARSTSASSPSSSFCGRTTYLVEFRTAKRKTLAVSAPGPKLAVLERFSDAPDR